MTYMTTFKFHGIFCVCPAAFLYFMLTYTFLMLNQTTHCSPGKLVSNAMNLTSEEVILLLSEISQLLATTHDI